MADPLITTVLVTGANGFIGRHLCRHLSRGGFEVRGLVRSIESLQERIPGVAYHPGVLPDTVDTTAFSGIHCVIHAAYTTRHRSLDEAQRINEEGTRLVIRCAENAGAKSLIFISSLSAHEGAESYYGRSKFSLESFFSPERDLIVRPGLVLGSGDAGLFGRMIEPVRRSFIVPLIDGGKQILQTIDIGDLCLCIETAIHRNIHGVLNLASPVGITLNDLLKKIAQQCGKHPIWFPVPSPPLLVLLRAAERIGVTLPVSSENVLGLRAQRYVDTTNDLGRLGLTVREPVTSIRTLFSHRGDCEHEISTD